MIRRPPRSTLFPTRRSSDLLLLDGDRDHLVLEDARVPRLFGALLRRERDLVHFLPDRKSTRLNSSHLVISYAVFCLKKKKEPLTCAVLQHTHVAMLL